MMKCIVTSDKVSKLVTSQSGALQSAEIRSQIMMLLRQLSHAIKNQQGASKIFMGFLGALDATSWFFMA